jgi:hypothetical protein
VARGARALIGQILAENVPSTQGLIGHSWKTVGQFDVVNFAHDRSRRQYSPPSNASLYWGFLCHPRDSVKIALDQLVENLSVNGLLSAEEGHRVF